MITKTSISFEKPIGDLDTLFYKTKKEITFWNSGTLVTIFIALIVVTVFFGVYMRYHHIKRFFKASFTDSIQLI